MVSVLIIGAGFAGAASAYFLSQLPGVQIRMVEREENFGMQASGKNAAMLRQAVPDRQTAQWIQETLAFLQNLSVEEKDGAFFQKTGSLLLGNFQNLQVLFENLREVGGRSQWVSSKNLPGQVPDWLSGIFPATGAVEGLFCPEDGIVNLRKLLRHLLSCAQKRGMEIFYRSEVTKISPAGEVWEITHGKEKFQAHAIINAGGAWCDSMLKLAGLPELHLVPHRRHLFKSRGWKFSNAGLPLVWDVAREVYFRPDQGELMLSPGDESAHPATPPAVDPQAGAWLAEKLQRAFPGLELPPLGEGWACLRTKSQNGKMYVLQVIEKPGYFCVAGLGGHGVGASVGLGRALRTLFQGWLEGKKSLKYFG